MRPMRLPLAITLVLLASTVGPLAQPATAQSGGAYLVSGHVYSDQGVGLAGVRVSGWTSGDDGRESYASGDTITDDTGAWTLHLGPGKGYVNVWYEKWNIGDGRDVSLDGDADGIDFILRTPPPKDAVIEGVVRDLDGNPIGGATVNVNTWCCEPQPAYAEPTQPQPAIAEDQSANSTSSGSSGTTEPAMIAPGRPYYPYYDGATATTDDDGRYRVDVYAGTHQLSVTAPGYAQTTTRVEAVSGSTANGDVTLEKVPPADARIVGRVVDARTGAPLANAWVYLNNLEWSRYGSAQTDSSGRFEIKTIPGWIQLSVNYYGEPEPMPLADESASKMSIAPRTQYYSYIVSFDADSGETTHDVKLQPKPAPSLVVIGYAVDPESQTGIPNAQVSFWNQDTGDWGSATTDSTGSYRILVRAGHYQVTGWADGYLGGAAMLDVAEGAAETRFDLAMPKGTTKYAPCEYDDRDCGGGGVVYASDTGYATPMATKGEDAATSDGAPPPAPAAAPGAPQSSPALASGSESRDASSTQAATFQGSGGGLPPYSPADAPEPGTTTTTGGTPTNGATTGGTKTDNVPGLGLVAALGVLGLLALALKRRR